MKFQISSAIFQKHKLDRLALIAGCLLGILLSECFGKGNIFKEQSNYLSPSALVYSKKNEKLYIALADAEKVAEFDIINKKVTRFFPVNGQPNGLVSSACGSNLYIATGSYDGHLITINLETGKMVSNIPIGHTPISPVLSLDGKILYVCNQFENAVAIIDLASMKIIKKTKVSREPIASVITPDNKLLLVANHLPAGTSVQNNVAAVVSVIDTGMPEAGYEIQLPNGSTGLRGICVSPDGLYAYVTHILARYNLPTTQLDKGWMNTNALSIIDVVRKKLVNTVLLDSVDCGAANPWAVTCTDDGRYLCVTHAGTHEISLINRSQLHKKLEKSMLNKTGFGDDKLDIDVLNDLSFLDGIRQRINLQGNGPRALVIEGKRIYIAEYFTDSLSIVDINTDTEIPSACSVKLGPVQPLTSARRGEMVFNDASYCFQGWQSCSSCHPQGRTDALNWDLLNDGLGNPKNTKSLLMSHKTPPVMISGARENAETAVREGIKRIQFLRYLEDDAEAIDEYLKNLEPVASPYLINKELNKSARRGLKVFNKAGCAYCHSGPLLTDLKKYDVGTGTGEEKDKKLDTPTLVEIWRTAPYLQDGRAKDMREVLIKYNQCDKHGKTSHLSEQEIDDLIEFILSN